jgi:2-dehydropantoate 2-reductase
VNILILGAGAMGTAVGGFLALAGHQITFIGRAPHVDALRASGLRISGIWGEHLVKDVNAFISLEEAGVHTYDLIIVAVKSYDTEKAACTLEPCVGPETFICAYQNGLGNAEILAQHFGWNRVLGARVIFGARINEPGQVEITVIAEPTAIGGYEGEDTAEKSRVVARIMDEAGIPTVYTDKIQTILWNKVAYNCALNPLSALLDVPYGHLAEAEYTRKLMGEVIHELYAVGTAMGIPLEPETSEAYKEKFYDKLLPPTAAHYASMREDLKKGRRTEIDALNGCITRFGNERGIPCPANALLTALIHAREKDNRPSR